jgi:hypothetical protein
MSFAFLAVVFDRTVCVEGFCQLLLKIIFFVTSPLLTSQAAGSVNKLILFV